MKIGVVGGGVVGHATARAFMEWAEIHVYDIIKEKRTSSLEQTLACDIVFICLPTPQKESGSCDTSYIDKLLQPIEGSDTNLIIKSTVPVGTTAAMRARYNLPNLVHSPEFLTQRCAVTDAQMPARNIIGGPGDPLSEGFVLNQCVNILSDLYKKRFPNVPVHMVSSDESEMIKLGTNGWFSVKLAYLNELHMYCDANGLDWRRVINGILADGRICYSHTKVPGDDGSFGFGGLCLPKDLANLVSCIHKSGQCPMVTKAALLRNLTDRLYKKPL